MALSDQEQRRRIDRSMRRDIMRQSARITFNVQGELVKPPPAGTPVDTGWARNNWIPGVREPRGLDQGPNRDPGRAGAAQSRGQSEVVRATTQPRLLPLFVANNTAYIGVLNNGSSKQSPKGFVQRAIAKAIAR